MKQEITGRTFMNKHLLYHGVFAAICAGTVVPAMSSAVGAEAAPPSVANTLPINLARGDLGTRLEARAPKMKNPEKSTIEENGSAQALISDDAALTYPLLPGKTSLILTLSKIQVLNRFNFINFGAAGTYSIAVSNTKLGFDAPGWRAVKTESFGNPQVVATGDFSEAGRYVKIDFNAERPGRISGLGLFGAPTIGTFEKKPLGYAYVSGSEGIPGGSGAEPRNVYFDLANLDTGARVVALSRGGDLDAAQAMIDDNAESSYLFDPTDPAPAVVVDLGVRRVINRLSCVYDAPPGRLDFYLVDNPYPRQARGATISYVTAPGVQPISNESGEYSGRSSVDGRQAIYSVDTSAQPGLNRLAADMPGQTGRFLVAEFHPLATGAAPAGDFKDFKDRDFKDKPDYKDFKDAGNPSQPLRVLSLSAFGEAPNDTTAPLVPPPTTVTGGPGGNPGAITPISPPSSGFIVSKMTP
jgi:hypothetical protein